MAYTRPSLSQIISDVKSDLFSRFPSLDSQLPNSMAGVIASVIAGAVSGVYDYLVWITRQMFPDTATGANMERWGNVFGVTRLPAAKATGNATFTGTPGSAVTTGAQMVSKGGVKYELITGFTLAAGSEDHAVRAVNPGLDGNQIATSTLTLSAAFTGINPTVTVATGGLTGGLDRETDEALRTRVLLRTASRGKGGSASDYDLWAREGVGATRTWVRNWQNAGSYGESVSVGAVKLYFAMDNTYSNGIPAAGDEAALQTYIDVLKPPGCVFDASAPTAYAVAVNLSITPDTPALRTASEAALKDAITEYGIVGGSIPLSAFQEAMTQVSGLTNWTINSPTGAVTASTSTLHTLGTVSYT